jgi:hypothetical protein
MISTAHNRVEAAERRVGSDHSNHGHNLAGLERVRRELQVIESDFRARGLLK